MNSLQPGLHSLNIKFNLCQIFSDSVKITGFPEFQYLVTKSNRRRFTFEQFKPLHICYITQMMRWRLKMFHPIGKEEGMI